MSTQKKIRTAASVLVLGTFAMTGCASKYGTQTTSTTYYPSCYQPVAELRQDENIVANSTATGAIGGALVGAILGGLITGKTEGALVGAAAGGAAGAVGGNIYGKNQEGKRNAEFYAKYSQQLNAETASMNRATAAARIASQCYEREFKKAISQAKSGAISKQQLSARYSEIRSGLEETSRILQTAYSNTASKDQEYQKAMAQEVGQKNVYIAQKAPQRISQPEVRAMAQSTNTWQASRVELKDTQKELDEQIATNDAILNAALEG